MNTDLFSNWRLTAGPDNGDAFFWVHVVGPVEYAPPKMVSSLVSMFIPEPHDYLRQADGSYVFVSSNWPDTAPTGPGDFTHNAEAVLRASLIRPVTDWRPFPFPIGK